MPRWLPRALVRALALVATYEFAHRVFDRLVGPRLRRTLCSMLPLAHQAEVLRVTARAVAIHPAVTFGSVVAGTALLGAVGALIAIPATATLQGFFTAYVRRYDVIDRRT